MKRELELALGEYVPFEGIRKMTQKGFIARAHRFRKRAEAIFQAECNRQKRKSFVTEDQRKLIVIVQQKGLRFSSATKCLGAYVCMYKMVDGQKQLDVASGNIVFSATLVDRGCPTMER
jgi:hypothetical protein